MEISNLNKKLVYFLACFMLAITLYGCKEKGGGVSLFDGLPESTFLTEIKSSLENKKPVAIAFTAEWCPHCKKYKPVFFEVKNSHENEVTFLNIDVDDANGGVISGRFQVRGIPTTAFVRADGSIFKVQVGEIASEDLVKIVSDLVKSKKKRRGEPIAPFPIEPLEVKQQPEPVKQPEPAVEESGKESLEAKPSEEKPPETLEQPTNEVETVEP